jgi:hypothetical protein
MNNLTSQVLDVTGASTTDGTLIQQWLPTGNLQQQWTLIPLGLASFLLGSGPCEIRNIDTGKALDITGASLSTGALLQQWDYLGGTNQQWQLVPGLSGKVIARYPPAIAAAPTQ